MRKIKFFSLLAGLMMVTTSLWADVVWTDWTESTSLPKNSGNYRLTCDVTLEANKTFFMTTNAVIRLDLNGYGICRTLYSHSIYYIAQGRELTIEDSNPTRIGGDNRPEGVYGGYITGGKGDLYGSYYKHGGAIYVYGGTFTMNGGTICGNACPTEGGAVWIGNNGTFIMNGGLLTNNTCNNGGCEVGVGSNEGAGASATRGTFIMNGGVIRHPYSNQTDVSAIRVNEGVMELHGGKIIGFCYLDEDKDFNAIEIYSAFVSTPEERCDFLMGGNNNSSKALTIKEPLGSNVFGVRPLKNNVTDPAPREFTQHLPGNGGISNFVSLDDNYYVILSAAGEGQLSADQTSGDPVVVTIDVPTHQDPLNSQWYYTTFYHSTQNYALTNDATEAFVADLSGSDLVLTKIAEGEQVIPANTGVIFRKSYSADPVVLAPTDAAGVSFTANNDLEGVDVQTDLTAIDGLTADNCYILSGQADDLSVVGVGFYKVNKTYLKEHKAYVKYVGSQDSAPRRMRFVFEQENTATGMESIQPSAVSSQKVLRDGQLIILRNGVEYNANGQIVK